MDEKYQEIVKICQDLRKDAGEGEAQRINALQRGIISLYYTKGNVLVEKLETTNTRTLISDLLDQLSLENPTGIESHELANQISKQLKGSE